MALIDLALAEDNVSYVDASSNPSETDLVNAGVLSADTVVYHGEGSVDLTDVLGVNALSGSYTVATGGADLRIDAGLLDLSLVTQETLIIDGDSSITVDAGAVSALSGVTNLLNNTTVAFSGSGGGTFTYEPPSIGVLSNAYLTVEEIGPGDKVEIPFAGDGLFGVNTLREAPTNAWDGEYLRLVNGDPLLNRVNIRIKMTPEQYNLYSADPDAFLNGDEDTFTFPGTADPNEPPYEAPCFTRGTLIETERGPIAIEDLASGDLVLTRDHGPRPIRWIGSTVVTAAALARNPKLRPIRIHAGALGAGTPASDLVVSPQHRILVRSKVAQRMFGTDEILVAAKQLLLLDGIDIAHDLESVEYFHILFDRHEVVISNGAETESLYTGPEAMKGIGKAAHEEIFALFPELKARDYAPVPARLLASGRMGRRLASRHGQNGKPLVN